MISVLRARALCTYVCVFLYRSVETACSVVSRAALVEINKARERKSMQAALERWSWEREKLETEIARKAEASGKVSRVFISYIMEVHILL